jgi:2-dehydropantoate 2-reductase
MMAVVQARGVDLGRHPADVVPLRLPAWLLAPAATMMLRHFPLLRGVMESHNNLDELRHTCRDALAEARHLDIPVPRLAAAEPFFQA